MSEFNSGRDRALGFFFTLILIALIARLYFEIA